MSRELTIDEVRERINVLDDKLQRECFGTAWIKTNRKSGTKPKQKMEADELFKEHSDDLLKMTDAGSDYKDEQRRLWKLKEKVVVPKVGPAEPACINDPTTGELITNKEEIKSKRLAHCVKILSKNPIRECDREELKCKQNNHHRIMNREDKGSYKLDKKLYKTVIKDIKKKNKGMFKLFNNAGSKYRKAIYPYMNRIIGDGETPAAFALTWLIAIWKKKGSALDLNQMRYIHTKLWDAKLCEALVTRNMKGKIVKACPNIQIGGMPNSSP
jgi:hypothetical protein